ncbi:hypothetical protein CKAN_02228000 [Cinnamomum micranthum f. kanehirae]|uniref:Uncharacterized protein n=1 Tax=Cinnamomum micranthum f. kanehirae TaxID=337451 RepID=A0A443PQJ6_9MAGN|nr:hypothetical protein CKAN_02228000 [Cinnamomum micranthum f. kanehirae]
MKERKIKERCPSKSSPNILDSSPVLSPTKTLIRVSRSSSPISNHQCGFCRDFVTSSSILGNSRDFSEQIQY